MEAPHQPVQSSLPMTLTTAAIQGIFAVIGCTVLIALTQNLNVDFSAKEVKTKINYKGSGFFQVNRQK